MPGAGTDKTKPWSDIAGPVVILVEPQLAENVGATARAMGNFGLSRLRIINPKIQWPNEKSRAVASGATDILEQAELFETLEQAIADCTMVLATTARAHDQAKPVLDPGEAARQLAPRVAAGDTVAIVFGRERNGLENHEVALADAIITLPVNPAFASLNLGQAVVIVAYEWFKHVGGGTLPFDTPQKSGPAPKQQLHAFFENVERELERVEFFRPPEKRDTMRINLRNIFHRMQPTQQDIQTLQGVIMSIAAGRKGPARGGILNGDEAAVLRTLLAEHGQGRAPNQQGPARGLARLLRRNPTEAERLFWDALTKDRRFAGRGFKRNVPIGPHINDVVSFPLRLVIDIIPADESEEAVKTRSNKRAWLVERGYEIVEIKMADIEADRAAVLEALDARISGGTEASP